jgi:hypothetical protein
MRTRLLLVTLLLVSAPPLSHAQTLTLSPAVVTLRGEPGASTTQRMTLRNDTSLELTFELVAMDVVTRDGARRFVAAGELPASIAATAVFSPAHVVVPAKSERDASVTVTLARGARHRAVVAMWKGLTPVNGATTINLGTLLTFSVGDRASITAGEIEITPQTANSNAAFALSCENDGDEPVVPKGVAVILDGAGAVVGKVDLEHRRLLPGERLALHGEYPGELATGSYRVIATLDLDQGRSLIRQTAMIVR